MCEVWSCIEPYHVCGFIYKAGPEGLLFKKKKQESSQLVAFFVSTNLHKQYDIVNMNSFLMFLN
jgi:hypothetical protein